MHPLPLCNICLNLILQSLSKVLDCPWNLFPSPNETEDLEVSRS